MNETRSLDALLPHTHDHSAENHSIDTLLDDFLEVMGALIQYDLATIMELRRDHLRVRASAGPLDGPKIRNHHLALDDYPSLRLLLKEERGRCFREEDHRYGNDPFDAVIALPHGHACMVIPLCFDGRALGLMTFDRKVCGRYDTATVRLAETMGRLLAVTLAFGQRTRELDRLVKLLQDENQLLSERNSAGVDARDLITVCPSPAMRSVSHLARQAAPTPAPVLITGETGTGKEVMAKAVHLWSNRSHRPIISINCAALTRELIESELFGHVKGAFTGAERDREGRFKAADGGTLMLDEVGELPLDLQARLLRVIQEGRFEPVGSNKSIDVDVRIIAATNVDLHKAVQEGRFREDLYYRLAVFPLHLPPLREREQDIPVIARNILRDLTRGTGRETPVLSDTQIAQLTAHAWPGNIRQLVNCLRRATVLSRGSVLKLDIHDEENYPSNKPQDNSQDGPFATMEEMERRHIRDALSRTGGKLYGEDGAAELLGVNPNTLRSRMRKLGLGGARDHKK